MTEIKKTPSMLAKEYAAEHGFILGTRSATKSVTARLPGAEEPLFVCGSYPVLLNAMKKHIESEPERPVTFDELVAKGPSEVEVAKRVTWSVGGSRITTVVSAIWCVMEHHEKEPWRIKSMNSWPTYKQALKELRMLYSSYGSTKGKALFTIQRIL